MATDDDNADIGLWPYDHNHDHDDDDYMFKCYYWPVAKLAQSLRFSIYAVLATILSYVFTHDPSRSIR